MVYESDFYTTRRPYRASPSLSTYTVSSAPSRQVRILPGIGKVHIVHTYDRIVPYVGHKRLTVVTSQPQVFKVRPSILYKEYDRIERKVRPWNYYSATNHYLNSDSAVRMIYSPYYPYCSNYYYPGYNYTTLYRPFRLSPSRLSYLKTMYDLLYDDYSISRPLKTRTLYNWYYPYYSSYYPFYSTRYYPSYDLYDLYRPFRLSPSRIFDDERRAIRAQTASLLKQIHAPVPRVQRTFWPTTTSFSRYDDLSSVPARLYNDSYIYKMLTTSSKNPRVEYTTYYTEPVKRFIGQGHLSCVSYAGDKVYGRRHHLVNYEDPLKNDIQLLSYYINRFREQKSLPPRESTKAPLSASRPSRIFSVPKPIEDTASEELKVLREARAARLAKIQADDVKEVEDPVKKNKKKKEEARLAEEKALAEEAARNEAQAKKDEATRKAELARQEELAAQAAAERAAELEKRAEQARQEELAKQAEIEKARKAEEEKARLEEERRLAEEAKAEEERQQLLRLEEIARQAEEEREAELARQAEELAELARQEAELAEQARKEAEEAEAAQKQAELEDLARQEAELVELEKKEKELAELAEKAKQEAELAELERQQAELDALEAEAKALEEAAPEPAAEEEIEPAEEEPAPATEETVEENIPADDAEAAESEEPVVEEPATPEVQEDAATEESAEEVADEE